MLTLSSPSSSSPSPSLSLTARSSANVCQDSINVWQDRLMRHRLIFIATCLAAVLLPISAQPYTICILHHIVIKAVTRRQIASGDWRGSDLLTLAPLASFIPGINRCLPPIILYFMIVQVVIVLLTADPDPEPCEGFLQRENFSMEFIESISSEDLQTTVKLCVDSLSSTSATEKKFAAAKLRNLAKYRDDIRILIAQSEAVPGLVKLLKSKDRSTQKHAVTALFNLSIQDDNKTRIAENSDAIKSLIYVLEKGTDISKQNAAAVLTNLATLDEKRKRTIGAFGAIPPLVELVRHGNSQGTKDALTALYFLCSRSLNKEKAVNAGVVGPLVGLVGDHGSGMKEKAIAMQLLRILAKIPVGSAAVVEEGAIPALVEAIKESSPEGKELAMTTLFQLCKDSVENRRLLEAEGGISPLLDLSQEGTARAKLKAKTLLGYSREARSQEVASSSRPNNLPTEVVNLTFNSGFT